jgi:hypothetical protein
MVMFPIEPPPSRDVLHWLHFAGPEEPVTDGFGAVDGHIELEPLSAEPMLPWAEMFPRR